MKINNTPSSIPSRRGEGTGAEERLGLGESVGTLHRFSAEEIE
jgi:hypothetical protein